MARLIYGRQNKLIFSSDSEFFEAYGFVCNNIKHKLEFQWEYNETSGAWGSEGRIHFFAATFRQVYLPMPNVLSVKLTAGNGRIIKRLNCNDYIQELVSNYGFAPVSNSGVYNTPTKLIPPNNPISFVPPQFVADYNRGYNM